MIFSPLTCKTFCVQIVSGHVLDAAAALDATFNAWAAANTNATIEKTGDTATSGFLIRVVYFSVPSG